MKMALLSCLKSNKTMSMKTWRICGLHSFLPLEVRRYRVIEYMMFDRSRLWLGRYYYFDRFTENR